MSWRERFTIHPACDVFRMMGDDELAALAEDIKTHGLRKRIIFLRDGADALLLDGRNRLAAMERAGIEIDAASHCQISDGIADPIAYIVSANLHRRCCRWPPRRGICCSRTASGKGLSHRHS